MMSDSESEIYLIHEDEDELSQRDYDLHYCESHDFYYCPEVDFCNPSKNCFPAMNQCKAYRRGMEVDRKWQ